MSALLFRQRQWLIPLLAVLSFLSSSRADETPLEQRRWFETRTAHFNIFSCGSPAAVYNLAVRLEQFRQSYSQLAGAQAVESPPIVVMAFPDHEAFKPYLPLYHGVPSNLAGFFARASDENLIALSLPEAGYVDQGMDVIYHEYAHLLFRRNDQIWPLWLKEGMAEIYSTFKADGRTIHIADPIPHHVQRLQHERLMPLKELFAASEDSADYNETDRQGRFYAQSWLLTHFLMAGDNLQYRAGFGRFTLLLRQGQPALQAFTNALQAPLPAVEAELRRYLKRGVFSHVDLLLTNDVSAAVGMASRFLTPVETYFRLGDELTRVDQKDAAEALFSRAQKMAPASPLPEEGLGIVAHERGEHEAAIGHLKASLQRGSKAYLAFYLCAFEEFKATGDKEGRYRQIPEEQAREISDNLAQSLTLMPSFGPAQQLCGIFEMVQGKDFADAAAHLQRAVELEPGNGGYILALAQYQFITHHATAARQTLEPLLYPNADAKVHAAADKLIKEFEEK